MKKNKGGRPSSYKPEYCQKLIQHMARGYPFTTFCLECDPVVNPDTLYEWLATHEEFSEAKSIAEQSGLKFHIDMLTDAMTVKKYFKNFIPACWIFKMKNMHNWADKIDLSSKDKELQKFILNYNFKRKTKKGSK